MLGGLKHEAAMAAWSVVEAVMAAEEQAWSAGSSAQLKAFLLHVVEWIWICLVQTVFVFQAPIPASELTRQQLCQVTFLGKSDSPRTPDSRLEVHSLQLSHEIIFTPLGNQEMITCETYNLQPHNQATSRIAALF